MKSGLDLKRQLPDGNHGDRRRPLFFRPPSIQKGLDGDLDRAWDFPRPGLVPVYGPAGRQPEQLGEGWLRQADGLPR